MFKDSNSDLSLPAAPQNGRAKDPLNNFALNVKKAKTEVFFYIAAVMVIIPKT